MTTPIPKRQGARKPPKPCPFQIGTRIRPNGSYEHHDYEQGRTYLVADIDHHSYTLRARNETTGQVGSWICWVDCTSVIDIGWNWLKDQLPAEALALLSAFDGLERLKLRDDVTANLVAEIPSLKRSILGCVEKLAANPSLP